MIKVNDRVKMTRNENTMPRSKPEDQFWWRITLREDKKEKK
jgi:hypothetical protein